MKIFNLLKGKAKKIKKELKVLYIAYKKPEVPWYAKVLAAIVVGYALSPIDLIPDFIPLLGYLDDLLLIPLGIYIALKLIPKEILVQCREETEKIFEENKPKSWIAGTIIIAMWIVVIGLLVYKFIFSTSPSIF
jgi:uncharacterized membrane protein YkvA (DUF1232 family)